MPVNTNSRYEDAGSVRNLYRTVRRSFLLSLSTFGLLLTIVGGFGLQELGHGIVAAIVGAVGITWLLTGLAGWGVYRLLERWD